MFGELAEKLPSWANAQNAQILMQALAVVLLIVLVARVEGFVGKGSALDHGRGNADVYGMAARYRGGRDDTGHGCTGGDTLYSQAWGDYTDDEYWRELPSSRHWSPTHGLQEYQADWAASVRQNKQEVPEESWDRSHTVLSEDKLAEHRHGVEH